MSARAPLDVDLEDRLVYGLTPIRLAYVVLGGLAALAMWSSRWPAAPVSAFVAVAVLALSAALAWGRWRGRPADSWLTDLVHFTVATRRVSWDPAGRSRRTRASSIEGSDSPAQQAEADMDAA